MNFNLKIAFFSLVSILNLQADTYIVDTAYSGNANSVCEHGDHLYNNVKSAVNAAGSNWNGTHTIRICPGTYNEDNIVLANALTNGTIESTTGDRNDVLIQSSSNNPIFSITGYLSNFTLKNLSITSTKNRGISHTNGGFQNSLLQNLLINTVNESLYFNQIQNLTLKDIDLTSSSGKCFYATNPTGSVTITTQNQSYNTFTCSSNGIDLGSSSQNYSISHTDITTTANNAASITATQANTLTIDDLISDSSSKGKGVWINGTINTLNLQNSILKNMQNEAVYCKTLKSSGTIISNNSIDGGSYGISLPDYSNRVTIQNNVIKNATSYGLYLLDSKSWRGSQIDHNCFINNSHSASSKEQDANFDNGTTGNYWSDWTGSGSYSIPSIPRYDYHPMNSCSLDKAIPIAEYRMDECSWSGAIGEVLDNSSNGYNGTLQKKTMILNTGIMGNAPTSFDADSYVEIPNFPDLTADMTITAWFKTTDVSKAGQRIFEDDQSNTGGYAISVGDGGNGTIRFYDRSQNYSGIIDSDAVLENNTWYFVAAVTDIANSKRYLYLYNANGTLISQKNSSINNPSRGSDAGVATIGGEPDGGETANRFKGSIDEIKIFSTPLSQTQIETILSNEKQGLNYDGTSRNAVCCCVPSGGNLIANPSFETLCNSNILATFNNVAGGTARSRSGLCGWEVAYDIETWENTTSPAASDGSVFVELDGASNHIDKIWQTLNTTEDQTYIIQFDYRKRSTSYKEGIIAKWNGTEIASVDGLTTKWQTAQIEVVGTSGMDTLTFEEPAASDDSLGSWIDNIRVIGGPFTTPKRYTFDAWDSFRSINDRNISTKIVNKPFTLSVASLDTANTALQDFNGTVCVQIIDTLSGSQLGRNCQVWNPLQSSLYTFTSPSATKNAAAKIAWKKSDLSGTFAIGSEDNATFSSDRFAIRPESFAIDAPDATAGKDFNITFTAPMYGVTTASMDYNETAGISFNVSIAEHKPACPMGAFTPSLNSFSFSNGSKILTTRYNEVGVLDVTISDRSKPCGSMYASIDCDDPDITNYYTQSSDLPIGSTSGQITVIPDHFDVNATLSNFNGKEFTYLSNDLNMSAQLALVITAKNGEGNTTKNYTTECYSKDTTLTLPHSEVPDPLTKILYSEALSAVNTNVLKESSWILTFNSDLFNNGFVDPTIDLNFDRDDSLPLNPFDFTVTSATATDPDTTGTGTPMGTAKFVYGRARAYDVTTNEASAPNPIEFEVYSTVPTGYVSGMPQNVLHWYRNLNHDAANQGNVIQGGFAAGRKDIDVSLAPSNGLQIVTVTSVHDQTVHLDISPWLWYSSRYDYNYASNCLQHPCFNYDYMDTLGAVQGVNSGTFEGSDFNMAPAQNITNKGVKVFR
ncbi:MAG: LamG-like jellyroll fold domain-containing protein [Sulfuricurvum sp.]|uniref:LamG-like jellyroll fold domain-containing protein n=1 Tax=Sulfuricurvum sp. TaxID=2025608 RepID=UPI003566DAF3